MSEFIMKDLVKVTMNSVFVSHALKSGKHGILLASFLARLLKHCFKESFACLNCTGIKHMIYLLLEHHLLL